MLSGKKAQQTALLMQRDFRGMWVKMIDDEGGGGVFFSWEQRNNAIFHV